MSDDQPTTPAADPPPTVLTPQDAASSDSIDPVESQHEVEYDRQPLPDAPPARGPFEAKAGSYYRNVRYGLTLLIFGYGLLSLYHGFVTWPRDTERHDELEAQITLADERQDTAAVARLRQEQEQFPRHDRPGIIFNQIIGCVLPPLAILLLIRWLYISRGRIRLDADDTLHVPGEAPIPAASVTGIDDARWDRKGISYVSYNKPGGGEGTVKLDDFVYEGKPVKHIHDRLASVVRASGADVEQD